VLGSVEKMHWFCDENDGKMKKARICGLIGLGEMS
jgi:hypothetical protein